MPPLGGPAITAVAELYQACQLRPPTVLVARDAAHFGHLVGRLVHSFGLPEVMVRMLLGTLLPAVFLALSDDVVVTACGAFLVILAVPWTLANAQAPRGIQTVHGGTMQRMLAALVLGAAVAGTAGCLGLGYRAALLTGGLALGAGGYVRLALMPLMPCLARWRLGRTLPAGGGSLPRSVIVRGATRVDGVLTGRFASALQDVVRARGPHPARDLRGERGPTQWARQAAIREAARDLGIGSGDVGLVLGQSVGHSSDPAAQVSALAAAGADHASLPRILQLAVTIDRQAEAVAAFRGVAVLLPLGAPTAFVPPPTTSRPHRRSGRLPWREALRWLGEAPGLAVAVDLVPWDRMADWLIARRLVRLAEARRRTPAIRALGVDRLVAALGLRPVQQDAHGSLYQIGPPEDPSAFVAVRDRVLDTDGAPLEHWIAVPPHVVTAREAVAWSFGMGEAEYRPTREA